MTDAVPKNASSMPSCERSFARALGSWGITRCWAATLSLREETAFPATLLPKEALSGVLPIVEAHLLLPPQNT